MTTNRETARGWEWTMAQRDAIKVWRRDLERKVREARGIMEGAPHALPEFAAEADQYARPFLEQAKDLLDLDCRRKGRKWQHMPSSAVAEKLARVSSLYQEYRECFLCRDDIQTALKEYNRGVRRQNRVVKQANREIVEQLASRNLAYVEELKISKEKHDEALKLVREHLGEALTLAVNIRLEKKLSEPEERALHRWITIQYVSIAASLAPDVRGFLRECVQEAESPDALLPGVHIRLVEHDIRSYNARIREFPQLIAFRGTHDPMSSFPVILNTIRHRLEKCLLAEAGKLPSHLEFMLLGRDFGLPEC